MSSRSDRLQDCLTAYDCRDVLPELSAWMTGAMMKELTLWKGTRFKKGHEYFDLDNPERGAFVATGDEGVPTDHAYVCRDDASERAWAQLITWKQPISLSQGQAIQQEERNLGAGIERSAAGDARPLPPR